ncbi:E3 ubiquitin-protein ligase TRIM21-like [Anabas testudineus]|uniref:E3 ubiquitin-protein ligase TRIM21-like n=1 Tax=Anabas testudineus TaxID=64144 RepID=UPI000E4597DC|nr:E3 ubiquitin-protein ligase TRIM21-like [Anabas testudineus]
MSAASCLLTEDQFLCSICLDVFTDPVSIPCGHNFCKDCITEYWNINVQCRCPVCKRRFNMRPELQINTFISEMAAQFRQSAQQKTSSSSSEQQVVKPEVHQMIQKRRLKIQEIKASVQLSNKDADREIAEGVQVFTALKESVERGQAELIKTIKEKQRTTEKQAEDLIKELEQEISDLNKRSSEVEQLSQAVAQLEEKLSKQMKKLFEAELKRVQQFADPHIILCKSQQSNNCRCSLSIKNFTSGKFYFDVLIKNLSTWTLGVSRKSNIEREIMLSPQSGYWIVCASQLGECYAAADPPVRLSLRSQPEKVGVFVDYEQGLVSFYDADTAAPIYSFTGCSFTEKLFPFFSSCPNDGVKGSWWSFFLRQHKLCLK